MKKYFIFPLCLFLSFGSFCSAKNKKESKSSNCCSIAYIDMEILLKQFKRVSDSTEEKNKRQEKDSLTIDKRKNSFDEALKEFQQKIENNAFSSIDLADKEHKRLIQMESDLRELNIELQQAREQEEIAEQIYIQKLIKEATEKYNQTTNFQFILTKDGIDAIVTANPEYDITIHILDILNAEYIAQKQNN